MFNLKIGSSMNYKYFDQKKVGGFLHVDFPFVIPSNKRVSFADVTYFIGYFKHGKFVVCHQSEDLEIARSLCDALQTRQVYRCVIVSLNVKTSLV